jgi:hypothetical protein
MTILKRLVVVTGQYTNAQGETKKRYKTVGHLHQGQHGEYITLDASVNLAAFPRKEGDDRVTVNLYDEESDKGTAKRGVQQARAAIKPEFDDEIPF